MWTQPEDPLGILWLSALVAVLPIATFLVLLVVFKMQGIVAAAISVVVEVIVALWAFGMPASAVAGAGLYGVLNALWPIAYIIVMAVWLYRLAVASGHFEVVQASISGISPDQRIQVLLIAFAFGAFLEGAAGFGVPIAICAALLVQLGFRPGQGGHDLPGRQRRRRRLRRDRHPGDRRRECRRRRRDGPVPGPRAAAAAAHLPRAVPAHPDPRRLAGTARDVARRPRRERRLQRRAGRRALGARSGARRSRCGSCDDGGDRRARPLLEASSRLPRGRGRGAGDRSGTRCARSRRRGARSTS